MAKDSGARPQQNAGADEATSGEDPTAGVADLSYEQARDELVTIVAALEGGQLSLEESMRLWDRGEALGAHCSQLLDSAQQRISDAGIIGRVAGED